MIEFDDIEQIIDSYPESWEIDLKQLGCGELKCKIRSISFSSMTVIWDYESFGSISDYSVEPDHTMFAFHNKGNGHLRWCGIEFPEDCMLVNPAGPDYVIAAQQIFDCFAIILPNRVFDAGGLNSAEILNTSTISEHSLIQLGPKGEAFRLWLARIFSDTSELRMIEADPVAAQLFQETVYHGIKEIFRSHVDALKFEPIGTSRRFKQAEAARNYIHNQEFPDFKTEAVAESLGITSRALRYAFKDAYGISPYQYILIDRLAKARMMLKEGGGPEKTVTKVAAEVGIFDFSRFSRYYSRTFGELPSQTFARFRALSDKA